jgi:alpha-glucosidase
MARCIASTASVPTARPLCGIDAVRRRGATCLAESIVDITHRDDAGETGGGSAWAWDDATGQYYLHSYLAEQLDLNWRNREVQRAMLVVLRFWMDRGVDGFRVDVLWELVKDDQFRDNPPNPHRDPDDLWSFEHLHVYNESRPEVHDLVRMMRREIDRYGDKALVGELYFDFPELVPFYGENLDGCQLPFNLALVIKPWRAATVADHIRRYEAALPEGAWPNWVLGNHDQSRIATRIGDAQARVAAMLLLTLRGTPTLYNGEEIGMRDVPIAKRDEVDPAGFVVEGMNRDPERTPMQWEAEPGAGFTTGRPWLPGRRGRRPPPRNGAAWRSGVDAGAVPRPAAAAADRAGARPRRLRAGVERRRRAAVHPHR